MIKDIQIVPLNPNKATVVKATGVIYVDYLFWATISENARVFTVLHENGHLALNSDSELKADEYAKKQMLKMGYTSAHIAAAAKEVLGYKKSYADSARITKIKGESYSVDPISPQLIAGAATAIAGAADSLFNGLFGLIGRGKREREAFEAAKERQQENNETLKDLAIIEARNKQNQAGLIVAVVALLAGTAVAISLLKSPKYPSIQLPKPISGPGKKLFGGQKLIN